LSAFPTAAAVLLPPALVALRDRAPALQVHFTEEEPPEAETAVRTGEADLALVFRHEDDGDAVPGDLLREPLASHPVHAVVTAGRSLPATLADLRDEPWIAGCVRCRGHLLRCARRAGFTPDVRFATDDHVVVQRLVGQGLGVALLPSWALVASTQPGVVAVDLPDVDGRVVETLARPDARQVPGVAALLAALRAAA
jgi:DNA-binding transcriptional LysR family regulator